MFPVLSPARNTRFTRIANPPETNRTDRRVGRLVIRTGAAGGVAPRGEGHPVGHGATLELLPLCPRWSEMVRDEASFIDPESHSCTCRRPGGNIFPSLEIPPRGLKQPVLEKIGCFLSLFGLLQKRNAGFINSLELIFSTPPSSGYGNAGF